MSLKDSIRKSTVGAKQTFRTSEIEWEGSKVGFKQLTQREKRELFQRCGKDADGNYDTVDLQIWATIYMTVDPETGEKVFTPEDYDLLNDQPSGSFVEAFSSAALKLLGGDDPKKSQEG